MDLRVYYGKIREAEASLSEEYPVTASFETSEGGKAGVLTEVPRHIAAKLIAEGRAGVATADQTEQFRESHRAAREKHEQQEAARRIQVMVIPQAELKKHDASKGEPAGKRERS